MYRPRRLVTRAGRCWRRGRPPSGVWSYLTASSPASCGRRPCRRSAPSGGPRRRGCGATRGRLGQLEECLSTSLPMPSFRPRCRPVEGIRRVLGLRLRTAPPGRAVRRQPRAGGGSATVRPVWEPGRRIGRFSCRNHPTQACGVTGSDRHEQIVRRQDLGPVDAAKRQENLAHLDLHTDTYV